MGSWDACYHSSGMVVKFRTFFFFGIDLLFSNESNEYWVPKDLVDTQCFLYSK